MFKLGSPYSVAWCVFFQPKEVYSRLSSSVPEDSDDEEKFTTYDHSSKLSTRMVPGYNLDRGSTQFPCFTINSHDTEGYALDWNAPSTSSLSLIKGNNNAKIYLTAAVNEY